MFLCSTICLNTTIFLYPSVSTKPPSGKKSSARQRLLRIEDQSLENHQQQLEQEKNEQNISNGDISMVSRPKSRFGNVAFDLLLDAPETGNMKKRPDLLPALEQRKKKKSKKVKTKEEIDKKMQQVEERRKVRLHSISFSFFIHKHPQTSFFIFLLKELTLLLHALREFA